MNTLSVVICAHNPKPELFNEVLLGLKQQDLNLEEWELIIIDNASKKPISEEYDISWHPHSRIVVETRLGLSHARLRGVEEVISPLIVFVDDDNILHHGFLSEALKFYQKNPQVGCFGGKSLPVFETSPPPWFYNVGINLGCQDYGDEEYISNYAASNFNIKEYPAFAPIGTGMIITKEAFLKYQSEVQNSPARLALGRRGNALTSGEDNDIILTLVKSGFEIAYVPSLIIRHLIPSNRYSIEYLIKMAFESNRSWVKVLAMHNLSPWESIPKWTLPFRLLRAQFKIKPWKSVPDRIYFNAAAGKLKGLSEL